MPVIGRATGVIFLLATASCRTDIPGYEPAGGSPQAGFDGSRGFGNSSNSGNSGGDGGTGGSPLCGDGVIDGGEQCDLTNLGGVDCTAFGFAQPIGLVCENCVLDPNGCQPVCGNLLVEPGEGCDDGNAVGGDGCSSTCFAEEDSCDAPIPVTLNPGSISIFGELGGPASYMPTVSAGCPAGLGGGPEAVYAVSVTEQGHVTAYLPSAGNSFNTILYSRVTCSQQSSELSCHDNDAGAGSGEVISSWLEPGETVYIFVDTGGAAIGGYELVLDLSRGGSCASPVPITVEGSKPINLLGRLSSLSDDASAIGCNGAGVGPDSVYGITFLASDSYEVDLLPSTFNSVLHARTSCEDQGSEIGCDSPNASDDSSLTMNASAGQTRFFWVDSFDSQSGAYNLTITH